MACEKCWGDAYVRSLLNPTKTQSEHYRILLAERKSWPCSRKEQLGQFDVEDSDVGQDTANHRVL